MYVCYFVYHFEQSFLTTSWFCMPMNFPSMVFESALHWPFCLRYLNLHSSDLYVYGIWICIPVICVYVLQICIPGIFLSKCFESVLQWPFHLCASNLHSSDLFIYGIQICTSVTFPSMLFESALHWPCFTCAKVFQAPLIQFDTRSSILSIFLGAHII